MQEILVSVALKMLYIEYRGSEIWEQLGVQMFSIQKTRVLTSQRMNRTVA